MSGTMDHAKGYRLERYGLDISPELIGVARQRLTKILRIFDAQIGNFVNGALAHRENHFATAFS